MCYPTTPVKSQVQQQAEQVVNEMLDNAQKERIKELTGGILESQRHADFYLKQVKEKRDQITQVIASRPTVSSILG